MAKSHRVEVKVVGYFTTVYVELEGEEIGLSYDGDATWTSVSDIAVDGSLDFLALIRGFNGTDWSVSITVDEAEKPTYQKKGTIKNNYSKLSGDIPLKQESHA